MPTEAGTGEHHVYTIPGGSKDTNPLERDKHYLGIDASAWYINKKSGWFSDRMASGTLEVTLSSGKEQFLASLGTFELKGGAKTAPVFQEPMLPDRNFLGGPITVNASLTAIKHDTALAGVLKTAGVASLGIVAGMVQTATMTGLSAPLAAAGGAIVGGVKTILGDTAKNREPLFDFSGLKISLQPEEILGPMSYVLLHRGAQLDEKTLSVEAKGKLFLPHVQGRVLDDGAWLLLRFRRSEKYSGVRDWFAATKSLRSKNRALVSDVLSGAVPKEEALKQFKPGPTGDATLQDEFTKLRAIMTSDAVLTEIEASLRVGELAAFLASAKKAIEDGHGPDVLQEGRNQIASAIKTGSGTRGPASSAFLASVLHVRAARHSRAGTPPTLSFADLSSTFGTVPKAMSSVFGGKGGKPGRAVS